MSGFTYFTKDALVQLKSELQKLKTVERQAASKAIAEAREKGDLRENAEYDAAKEAQGLLEAKIQKLESDLANARVMDQETIDTSKVSVLTKVTVTNLTNKKTNDLFFGLGKRSRSQSGEDFGYFPHW